jgi:hypothetical protein
MKIVTRNQNPVIGDTIALKLYSRNSNNFADLYNIDHIDIMLENCPVECANDHNPNPIAAHKVDTLIQTIPGSEVKKCCTGIYDVNLVTSAPTYVVGNYHDVWYVQFTEQDVLSPFRQDFKLNPDLWVLSGTPVVYSFDFRFTPNRIRKGSKKHLVIQIIPNVPRATDLFKYYENIAISSELRINIELNCGQCVPQEADLRKVIDNERVFERDKVFSYYFIDTCDWECGIYDVWFEIDYAGSTDISPRQQFQLF